MKGTSAKPKRVAALLLFGIAGLLAVRVAAGFLAADVMESAYLDWCAETGYPANEYGLNCERTTGFLEASTRTLPVDLLALIALCTLGIMVLEVGRAGRILTYLAASFYPLWAVLSTDYFLNLQDRLAGAAVLTFPEVVPQWYLGVSVAIGPVTAVLLLVAAATLAIATRTAEKQESRPVTATSR
ncbi:MAG: hypothetical protein ACRD0P_10600 [Stackebrandtia sp.]